MQDFKGAAWTTRVRVGGGAHGLRLGARFVRGSGFGMALEGERGAGRAERAGHGVMLRGWMRW